MPMTLAQMTAPTGDSTQSIAQNISTTKWPLPAPTQNCTFPKQNPSPPIEQIGRREKSRVGHDLNWAPSPGQLLTAAEGPESRPDSLTVVAEAVLKKLGNQVCPWVG
jgi:hypothetical protein